MIHSNIVRNTKIKRVVLKVGSNLLINNGKINKDFISNLCKQISELRTLGVECIIVSSGAVGCGLDILKPLYKNGTTNHIQKLSVPEKQAAAAIGQGKLIQYYSESFLQYNIIAAQLLVTYDDIHNRLRYLNIKNTVTTLLKQNVVPIFNENDTVSVDEITFGDNDYLSALVTHLVGADLLVLLSTINGLLDYSTSLNGKYNLINDVYQLNADIRALIKDDKRSSYGTGGMTSKISAAEKLMQTGHLLAIINGSEGSNLDKLFNNETIGTVFYPKNRNLNHKKLWIGFAGKSKGNLEVDSGAAEAILDKNKSLLPVGVIHANGLFGRGDIVNIIYNNKTIAKGQINYSLDEVNKIKQLKSSDIIEMLGYKPYDEIVHKDNMVIF